MTPGANPVLGSTRGQAHFRSYQATGGTVLIVELEGIEPSTSRSRSDKRHQASPTREQKANVPWAKSGCWPFVFITIYNIHQ